MTYRGCDQEIRAGDLVAAGQDEHPRFEVLAVHGDKAWLRDVETGSDHLALIGHCRRLDAAADGLAPAAR